MKKLIILSLLLAGCQSTAPTTRLHVITPPDEMYDCPIKTKWPNWKTLNDTLKGLDVYLDTHKDEKESSEVLKRTIRELSQ